MNGPSFIQCLSSLNRLSKHFALHKFLLKFYWIQIKYFGVSIFCIFYPRNRKHWNSMQTFFTIKKVETKKNQKSWMPNERFQDDWNWCSKTSASDWTQNTKETFYENLENIWIIILCVVSIFFAKIPKSAKSSTTNQRSRK